MLQQPSRELLRRTADVEPEIERRHRPGEPQALLEEGREKRLALAAIQRADRLDVGVVRPGGDGRALNELLRGRADGGAKAPQRRDDLRDAQTNPDR